MTRTLQRSDVANIYCIGRNYAAHAKELGNDVPTEPVVFLKSTACLRGLEDERLAFPDESFHHEAELVVLVGREIAWQTTAGWDDVEALGLGLDLTRREVQTALKAKGLPWTTAKSFFGSAVVTPFTPVEAFTDPNDLAFELRVNAELRQQGRTTSMLFSVPRLLTYLASLGPLGPGDLIFTGTPAGVGPISKGDLIELGFVGTELRYRGVL